MGNLFSYIGIFHQSGLILKLYKYLLGIAIYLVTTPIIAQLREYKKTAFLMGSAFEFTIVDSLDSSRAMALLDSSIEEVSRIERLISSWDRNSSVYELNNRAGKDTLMLDKELYSLIQRSISISKLTQGAFDISFATNLSSKVDWFFDGREYGDTVLTKTFDASYPSYENIMLLDSTKVFLASEDMKIGFGAIGKGYASDRVKSLLINNGIKSGVINASGDLTAWGTNARNTKWNVGIAEPDSKEDILLWIPVSEKAVATSGDYEKFIIINNKRYSHIINPKTGVPTQGIKSSTVISNSAELSDALATSLFVMGIDVGIHFIDQLQEVDCIIIDSDNKLHFSAGFNQKSE